MHTDFMAMIADAPRLVGINQGNDRRHEEAGRNLMSLEAFEYPRYTDPPAEFAPRQTADGTPAGAQLECLVVAVEGQGDRCAGIIRPCCRFQRTPGAHRPERGAPIMITPLPGRQIFAGHALVILTAWMADDQCPALSSHPATAGARMDEWEQ